MLNFHPDSTHELKPRITVVGVGGAGGNAVNNMIASKLEGVDFVVANTDAQSIAQSRTERRIQLGTNVTQGLGAGSRPDIGRAAAEESLEEIINQIGAANMVFITAGMGGGTGSGAAPVIARAARDQGILTVGVVTKPFHFEGAHRMRTAEGAIEELSQYVDTLIIIPNQNLFRVATERTTFADAFKMADDVLYSGVRGVTDLMIMPGLINLDFADIRTVMSEMGKAMMGTGEADGDKRAIAAAEAAISNPLLDDTSMKGAKGVLINITGGSDMTLFEVDEAANRIRDEVDPDANIIFGSTFDENLTGKMRVSVVATGIASEAAQQPRPTMISLVGGNAPAQPKVAAAPAATPVFQPRVVTAGATQAAAIAEPVVARAGTATVSVAAAAKVIQPDLARDPRVEAAFNQRVEPAFNQRVEPAFNQRVEPAFNNRPEPAFARSEPAFTRPEPSFSQRGETATAQRVEPSFARQPEAEAEFPPAPDMSALTQAVGDIAAAVHRANPAPAAAPAARPAQPAPAQAQARPQPQPEPEPRRTGSLFERLVASRRPAQPAPQPARQEAASAPPAPQPRMAAQPAVSRASEDLDIPAFLRRQAN
ncbi:cell division protein FtsZ [Magnetospirillum sp. UT-4]|uniref:cell division protein FtsZ n=1 Tax=Magnetospirillum sp. UT-4 TaxID=2681467 RepID=UPI001383CFD5|nr:cell division protein FtsZ [Magnetospirillum sp. UT-4]CAA7618495.1 Cell division protein FtsZ 1 [Magnetospirillum sp. UT-4]